LLLLVSSTFFYLLAARMRISPQSNRVFLYVGTIVLEWLVTGYVLFGVRSHHTSLLEVIGAKWNGARDVFRDVGVALAFWVAALVVLGIVSHILHVSRQNIRFLAPQTSFELVLWIALSVTAGFCEETLFRGYLQKQFIAWTHSVHVGIFLSAITFGAGHLYQGAKSAVVITVFGLLFGILAQWRRSMRPGMLAHAWQDTLSGLAMKFISR
jgi:membrane protease YdiL (CAAX protease family)